MADDPRGQRYYVDPCSECNAEAPYRLIKDRQARAASRPGLGLHTLLYLLLPGCQQLPDIRYETEHVRIGTFFEHEVCEGSVLQIDNWATTAAEELGIDLPGKRTVYWGREGVDELCSGGTEGCYDGDQGIVVSDWESIPHELVHATRTQSRDVRPNTFIEEGLAEALTTSLPDRGDVLDTPSSLITLSQRDFESAGGRNVAGHFIRYVRDAHGMPTVLDMRGRIGYSTSLAAVDGILNDLVGASLADLEEEWLVGSPTTYVLADATLPLVALTEDEDEIVLEGELDCSNSTTFGPLTDEDDGIEHAGMYTMLRFDVAKVTRATLQLSSPNTSARVTLLAGGSRCWQHASSGAPREIELSEGEEMTVELGACRWKVMVSVTDYSRSPFSLNITQT